MKILAIDFSSSVRSIALVQFAPGNSSVLGQATEQGTRETNAFKSIETVLDQAAVDRTEVDALAIGLGPGSYGGIRVSLSIAQGWQVATQIKTAGIDTVHVLAESARQSGHRGNIEVLIDAQRNECYHMRFELNEHAVRSVGPLRIVTRADLAELIAAGGKLLGPDLADRIEGVTEIYPDAAVLAGLAAAEEAFVSADQLKPIYTRPIAFVKAPPPRTDLR